MKKLVALALAIVISGVQPAEASFLSKTWVVVKFPFHCTLYTLEGFGNAVNMARLQMLLEWDRDNGIL